MSEYQIPYDQDSNFQFDSKAYLQRYTDPKEALGIQVQFLECWHMFYHEHGKEFDPQTAQMLEFGGGPTLWSLISVAPNVSKITFTDFAETNRAEIQKWKSNDSDCHNWRPYIEHVVQTLEGNTDPNAVDLREQEVRSKIQNIAFCDARSDQPLGNIQDKFDVIHTNFCLEAVLEDKESFYAAFGRLHACLKPGGYLLCLTALEGTWYVCWKDGSEKLHQLAVTSEDVDLAFTKAGFTIVTTHVHYPVGANVTSASKNWKFIVGRKNK